MLTIEEASLEPCFAVVTSWRSDIETSPACCGIAGSRGDYEAAAIYADVVKCLGVERIQSLQFANWPTAAC
jgi:hypothetical protein